ncbi:MAG: metallophosphoesterase [Erysipelotrichaceae bacterium]
MKKYLYLAIVLFVLLLVFLIIENKRIKIKKYCFKDERIDKAIRIVVISDQHNTTFGKNNCTLIEKVRQQQADLIFLTGDLIDKRRTNMAVSLNLVKELVKIADCYYIGGNHESVIKEYDSFQDSLQQLNVKVINDSMVTVNSLNIYGIKDYNFFHQAEEKNEEIIKKQLDGLNVNKNEDEINILLVHRPHYFDIYCQYNFDYIFAGHVHGGQMRLPLIGGVYGPNQGLFPKYDCGLYQQGKTKMVISAGLGNSLFPLRIFDNPQLVVVEISADSQPE